MWCLKSFEIPLHLLNLIKSLEMPWNLEIWRTFKSRVIDHNFPVFLKQKHLPSSCARISSSNMPVISTFGRLERCPKPSKGRARGAPWDLGNMNNTGATLVPHLFSRVRERIPASPSSWISYPREFTVHKVPHAAVSCNTQPRTSSTTLFTRRIEISKKNLCVHQFSG